MDLHANDKNINQNEDDKKTINNLMLQSRIKFHDVKRQTNQSLFDNQGPELFSQTIYKHVKAVNKGVVDYDDK